MVRTIQGASAPPMDDPLSNRATAHPDLLPGEPFGHGLGRSGPVPTFTETERKPETGEAPQPGRQRRRHGGDGVSQNGEAQTCSGAESIDGPSGERLTYRIGDTKRNEHEGELGVRPSVLGLQVRAEDAQRLTIDVVDDG